MTLPAVIFDLDGTLVDSEPLYHQAARRLLAQYGVADFSWQQHARYIGVGTRETMTALRAEYAIDAPVDELLAGQDLLYLESARTRSVAFPAMRDFVASLHGAGHALAVASGSSRSAIAAVLTATGLDALLPLTVSAEEVARGKPAPDVFLETARRLGVDPADCAVVEDSPAGAEAADRAGMRCIAIPYAAEQLDDPAYATAGLLVTGGQRSFDPRAAYAWLTGATA